MTEPTDAQLQEACDLLNAEGAWAFSFPRDRANRTIRLVARLIAKQQSDAQDLHIIFDGPPGPSGYRFVECETSDGHSVNAGDWSRRDDGYWQLVIPKRIANQQPAIAPEWVEAAQLARRVLTDIPASMRLSEQQKALNLLADILAELDASKPDPLEQHIATLEKWKADTPVYDGDDARAVHYRRNVATLDAAIDALRGLHITEIES